MDEVIVVNCGRCGHSTALPVVALRDKWTFECDQCLARLPEADRELDLQTEGVERLAVVPTRGTPKRAAKTGPSLQSHPTLNDSCPGAATAGRESGSGRVAATHRRADGGNQLPTGLSP
jgi:hypothetical protein